MNRTTKTDQNKLKSQAPADGSRRYNEGIFPAYDKEYNRLANSSVILGRSGKRDYKNAFSASGLGECKGSLLQLVGNDDGKYKENGTWYTALIPAAVTSLKETYADFKRWQQQQVRSGQALQPPKEWPDNILNERLKAEARLDVRRKEKAILEDKIEELKAQQGKLDSDVPLLPDGPVGNFGERPIGKFRKKTLLDHVDGQNISFTQNDIPFIDHPESPYHQMPVATYRKMSKEWKQEHEIRDMDLVKRAKAYREEAREIVDNFPPMFGKRSFKKMIQGRTTFNNQDELPEFEPWPENPEWPEGAKTIEEIEDEAE